VAEQIAALKEAEPSTIGEKRARYEQLETEMADPSTASGKFRKWNIGLRNKACVKLNVRNRSPSSHHPPKKIVDNLLWRRH
jgi:hypothetical protein